MTRRVRVWGGGLTAALALLVGATAVDVCRRQPEPSRTVVRVADQGTLRAGAASRVFELRYPVVRAGSAPPRAEAMRANVPPRARAVILETGQARIGLLSLELMLTTRDLTDEIRAQVKDLELDDLWVVATHTHSSVGAFAREVLVQVAGTGRYRPEVRRVLSRAASEALRGAAGSLQPVTLSIGELPVPELVTSRSGGEADARLTVASMAAGAKQVAELVLFAAHPTLAPHREDALDPDYPGRMSAAREQGHGGVSLFLPASVGNASGRLPEAEASNHPGLYAAALAAAVARTPVVPVDGPVALGASRVEWTLPDPDASRLSPPWTGRAADNALCALTPARTEVAALRLGPLRWLAVPLEPTYGAAQVLEHAAGASRVVALEGDYLSYVETSDAVRGGNGEAARQYFEPSLLAALEEAASRALRELEPTQTPTR